MRIRLIQRLVQLAANMHLVGQPRIGIQGGEPFDVLFADRNGLARLRQGRRFDTWSLAIRRLRWQIWHTAHAPRSIGPPDVIDVHARCGRREKGVHVARISQQVESA